MILFQKIEILCTTAIIKFRLFIPFDIRKLYCFIVEQALGLQKIMDL